MGYTDAATLKDTCDAYATDTPGKNAGCKFLGQAEDATTAAANRPHLALAENCDYLMVAKGFQRYVVCDAAGVDSGVDQDCDYAGVGAIDAAIGASKPRIYVRNGAYTSVGSPSLNNDAHIVGESRDGVTYSIPTGQTVTVTDKCRLESLTLSFLDEAAAQVIVNSPDIELRDVRIEAQLTGATSTERLLIDRCDIGGFRRGIRFDGVKDVVIRNSTIRGAATDGTNESVELNTNCERLRFENVEITGGAGAVIQTALTMDDCKQVSFDNCIIRSTNVGAAAFTWDSDVVDTSFDHCHFYCEEGRIAQPSTGNGGNRISWTNCTFEMETSGAPTTPDGFFFARYGRYTLDTVTFIVTASDVSGSGMLLELFETHGRDIVLNLEDLYNKEVTLCEDIIYLNEHCDLEGVEVIFPSGMTVVGAPGAQGCVNITKSRVRRLSLQNLSGVFTCPLVYLTGLTGERACLDGFEFSSDVSWAPYSLPAMAEVRSFSTLKGAAWNNAPTAGTAVAAVIVLPSPYQTVVEDCTLLIHTYNTDIKTLIKVDADDGRLLEIRNNYLYLKPLGYVGYHCIHVSGANVKDAYDSQGLKNGHIHNNEIVFFGEVEDNGVTIVPTCNPVYIGQYCYFWNVSHNQIAAVLDDAPTVRANDFIIWFHEGNTLGVGIRGGGGSICAGNILWAYQGSNSVTPNTGHNTGTPVASPGVIMGDDTNVRACV